MHDSEIINILCARCFSPDVRFSFGLFLGSFSTLLIFMFVPLPCDVL